MIATLYANDVQLYHNSFCPNQGIRANIERMQRIARNLQRYQLLDVSESQIEDMPLPSYRIKCSQLNLFCWKKWVSFAWIKFTYITMMLFFILLCGIEIIRCIIDGNGWKIFGAFVFVPIFCILCIAGIRIFTEVLLSILIIPHQLHTMTDSLKELRSSMPPQQIQLVSEQPISPMETR